MAPEADIEVLESSDMVRYLAVSAVDHLKPQALALNTTLWPTKQSMVVPTPLGVVAVIKPWNYPLEVPLWSIAAALVAGNTVVFKPSEHSSVVGAEIALIFQKAGLPAGVLNIINGDGTVGRKLVVHPRVAMVSFTGSKAVGVEIAAACASSMKRYVLELSGNDAALVCEDADLELAANGLTWGAVCNAGQVCTGVKRAYVHAANYDSLIKTLVPKIQALKLGVDVGPIISKAQRADIDHRVKQAVREGAKLVLGGKAAGRDGYYYEPTLLIDVPPTASLMREECFGPVLPIVKVNSEEEAVRLANDCDYGLGASVWTRDLAKAERLAGLLDAGMVWHNDVNVAFPEAPWGGIKHSGRGDDLSKWSLDEYVFKKHVCVEKATETSRFWWFPYKESEK